MTTTHLINLVAEKVLTLNLDHGEAHNQRFDKILSKLARHVGPQLRALALYCAETGAHFNLSSDGVPTLDDVRARLTPTQYAVYCRLRTGGKESDPLLLAFQTDGLSNNEKRLLLFLTRHRRLSAVEAYDHVERLRGQGVLLDAYPETAHSILERAGISSETVYYLVDGTVVLRNQERAEVTLTL